MAAPTKISASCTVSATLAASAKRARVATLSCASRASLTVTPVRQRTASASLTSSTNATSKLAFVIRSVGASSSLAAATAYKKAAALSSLAAVSTFSSRATKIKNASSSPVSAATMTASRPRLDARLVSLFGASATLTPGIIANNVLFKTDQTGANTHICVGNSIIYNFSIIKTLEATSAVFAMKKAKNATDGCRVTIYDQKDGGGNVVSTSFIPATSFNQQWTDMTFGFDAVLVPDINYSLVISSNTLCNDNNDSFFIKSGGLQIVDFATGAVYGLGYELNFKTARSKATMLATATRIRNAVGNPALSVVTENSAAVRGRFVQASVQSQTTFGSAARLLAAGAASISSLVTQTAAMYRDRVAFTAALVSSYLNGHAFRRQEIESSFSSEAESNSAGRLLAAGKADILVESMFDSELTGGIVADNLILNYNLVQPESFDGEGSDTIRDIVMNSDMRLFPKPAIAATRITEGIGHWDLNSGIHKRKYPNFPFYIRNRYGRKNAANRIVQEGAYYSDFAFGTIRFNGIDSYGITQTDLTPKFETNKMSVFVWVYPGRDGVILSEQGSTTPNENWYYSQIEVVEGRMKFGLYTDEGIASVISNIDVEYFHWRYVGFTYDGSTMRCFIDGQECGNLSLNRIVPGSAGQALYYCLGNGTPTNMGDGRYGSFRFGQMHLYADSLTPEEVYFNWYNTRARYEDPDHYLNSNP